MPCLEREINIAPKPEITQEENLPSFPNLNQLAHFLGTTHKHLTRSLEIISNISGTEIPLPAPQEPPPYWLMPLAAFALYWRGSRKPSVVKQLPLFATPLKEEFEKGTTINQIAQETQINPDALKRVVDYLFPRTERRKWPLLPDRSLFIPQSLREIVARAQEKNITPLRWAKKNPQQAKEILEADLSSLLAILDKVSPWVEEQKNHLPPEEIPPWTIPPQLPEIITQAEEIIKQYHGKEETLKGLSSPEEQALGEIIQAAKEAERHPLPNDPHTQEAYLHLLKTGRAAQDLLVMANIGLVKKAVNQFLGKYPFLPPDIREDMEQDGKEALVKAAQGFDPRRGVPFSSYAKTATKRTISRTFARWTGASIRALIQQPEEASRFYNPLSLDQEGEKKREDYPPLEEIVSNSPPYSRPTEEEAIKRIVLGTIDQLPSPLRKVLDHYLQGYPLKEITEIINQERKQKGEPLLTPQAISFRLQRGKKMIREKMEQEKDI